MWFSRKQVAKSSKDQAPGPSDQVTTKRQGDAAETLALKHLIKAGLKQVETNYRTPGRGGGEIDIIMSAPDGTLVFVEVRQRSGQSHGGAGASIGAVKQRRIIMAARHYLMRFASLPPCRFDVVLIEGSEGGKGSRGSVNGVKLEWLQAAFDAS